MSDDMASKVRLRDTEIKAIQECFTKYFNAADHLWIFGSRADMTKRGGDIDLYIETTVPSDQILQKRLKFNREICDRIGEQKIDIVIHMLSDSNKLDIYSVAKNEGIQLV